jgi:hypothetical protein
MTRDSRGVTPAVAEIAEIRADLDELGEPSRERIGHGRLGQQVLMLDIDDDRAAIGDQEVIRDMPTVFLPTFAFSRKAGPRCDALTDRSQRRSAGQFEARLVDDVFAHGRAPVQPGKRFCPLCQRNVRHSTVFDSTALSTTAQDSSSATPDSVRKLAVANSADMAR